MKFMRVTIEVKDIQRITGKSDRSGRAIMRRMKEHFHKDEHQFITVEEFCKYSGLKYDDVVHLIE